MRIMKVTMLLTVAFLAVSSLGAGSLARAQESQPQLSAKQLRTLIATAKTPADHQRIAAYYRAKAAQDKAEAAEHEKMLAAYNENPLSHPIAKAAGGPAEHCSTLIRLFNEEARQDLALAAEHEKMAKEASEAK